MRTPGRSSVCQLKDRNVYTVCHSEYTANGEKRHQVLINGQACSASTTYEQWAKDRSRAIYDAYTGGKKRLIHWNGDTETETVLESK